jgi:hypothetical protein
MSRSISARWKGTLMTVGEIFRAIAPKRHRRFMILLPVLLLLAVLLAVVSSSGVLAPFVYPLF